MGSEIAVTAIGLATPQVVLIRVLSEPDLLYLSNQQGFTPLLMDKKKKFTLCGPYCFYFEP